MLKLILVEKSKQERKQIRKLGNIFGLVLTAFIGIQFVCVILLQISGFYDVYENSALFQTCFNIVVVDLLCIVIPFGILALTNKNNYQQDLIPTEKISAKSCYLWVTFGMLCCILANYVVSIMVVIFKAFGHDPLQIDTPEPTNFVTSVAIAIGTAVMPALCEEFAMRCCGLGLLKKHGKAFGVVAISIVFGLMHGNIIQFVFATLIGLILGYVTIKTNSIVPAVLIHLFNNSMSVVSSIAEHFSEATADNVTKWFFVLWVFLGVVSAVLLAVKGSFKRTSKQYEPFQNSTGKKVFSFFCVPGMILPFIYFIVSIILSIQ